MNALVVSRTGTISTVELSDAADYFKTCGFRNPDGFEERAEWTVDGVTVKMYAKTKGKAHTENKYEFPPPVDKSLYYGRCLLVNPAASLTEAAWEGMYETLMSGFEDLHTETESEDE